MMLLNRVGPVIALCLACIGSSIGCGIACMASHGAMARDSEGHGKYIMLSMAPCSQALYGFMTMILMKSGIDSGSLSGIEGIAIGLFVGLACCFSAIYQGKCMASGMAAIGRDPNVFGKVFVALGALESFALFAFIFSKLLY